MAIRKPRPLRKKAQKGRRRKKQMGGQMDPNMQDPNMMQQDPAMAGQDPMQPGADFIEPEMEVKFGAPRDKKFFGGAGRARRQARRAARQAGPGAGMQQPGAGMAGRMPKPGMGGEGAPGGFGGGLRAAAAAAKQKMAGQGGLPNKGPRPGMAKPGFEGSGQGKTMTKTVRKRRPGAMPGATAKPGMQGGAPNAGPMVQKPGMGAAKNGRYRAQQGKDKRSYYEKAKDEMGQIASGLSRMLSDKASQGRIYSGKSVNPIDEFKKGYNKQEAKDHQKAGIKSEKKAQLGSPVGAYVKRKMDELTGEDKRKAAAKTEAAKKAAAEGKPVYGTKAYWDQKKKEQEEAKSKKQYGGARKKKDEPRERALFGKIAGAIGGIKRAKAEGKKLGSGLLKEAGKGALAGGTLGRIAGAAQGFFNKENKGKGLKNRLRQAGAGALGGFNNLANSELGEAAKTKGGLKDYMGDKIQGLKDKLGNKGKGDNAEDASNKPKPSYAMAPPMTAMVKKGGRPADRRRRRRKTGGYAIESTSSGKQMADTLGVKKNRKKAQVGYARSNRLAQKTKERERIAREEANKANRTGVGSAQDKKADRAMAAYERTAAKAKKAKKGKV